MLHPAQVCAAMALLAALPGAAMAAPFCVSVQGLPDQCVYVDTHDCAARAQQLGGVCITNDAEVTTPPGPGDFCLADSGRVVMCIYSNRPSCEADAARRHAACVQTTAPPEAPGTEGVDPYEIRRPY